MRSVWKIVLPFLGFLSLSGCTVATAIQVHDMGGAYVENPVYGLHGYYVHLQNYTGIGFDLNDQKDRYDFAEELVPSCQTPSVAAERVVEEGANFLNIPRREYIIEIKCAGSN
jgi:hypothetical protein